MAESNAPGPDVTATESKAQRLQRLFAAAAELDETARIDFLRRECADDAGLLAQLGRLLRIDARLTGTTVRSPASGLAEWINEIATPATLSGLLIGPYRVCELLGQGGMGSVYRAERADGVVQQQVAIKFVRRELIGTDTLHRFQLERQTLASLDHPNIARLIDASALADGTPFFVMEHVAGVAITDYCRSSQLDLRARLQLFRHVCAAVSHAHRNLVVHRDLKPGNILVTGEGVPKLLDFGIAKSLQSANGGLLADQTGTAQRFFSPRYAAPEQLLGAPISVGCDIYALGLLLYEMLAGIAPFELDGLSAGQIERLLVSVPPPAPSQRCLQQPAWPIAARALRGDLDGVVLRCLRKAPSERYASVEQLEADIGRYLQGHALSIRHGQSWYRLRKFIGRHRLSAGVVTIATLALAATLTVLVLQNDSLRRERDLSQQSLGILKDAFIAADPIQAAGADVSARQILDAARVRIDGVADTRPDLFAALAQPIAEVDLSLGRINEAADLLARASDAAQRAGAGNGTRQHLLILQARALTGADRADAAERVLQAALAIDGSATPEWKMAAGRLRAAQGRTAEAIALLEQSVAALSSAPPTVELANAARLALADAHWRNNDAAAAVRVLDDTLRWQRAGLPATHPQITRTRLRRVVPLRDSGQADESLSEALAIVDEIERVYGKDSSEAAYAQAALARSLDAVDRDQEALVAYRRALRAWRRSVGLDHPNTLRAAFNLAYSLQLKPDTIDEAERVYRQLLNAANQRSGPQDEMVVYYRLYFGKLLLQRGRSGDAFETLAIADGWPGLAASSAGNRSNYLDTLQILQKQVGCAPAGSAPASIGNAALQARCALVADWVQRAALLTSTAR